MISAMKKLSQNGGIKDSSIQKENPLQGAKAAPVIPHS